MGGYAAGMKPPPASPAWAHVRILLNLGDIPAATTAATAALRGMSVRYSSRVDGTKVVGNADIPLGWVYLNPTRRLAVLNLGVWCAHTCHGEMYRFCGVHTQLSEPVFARYDAVSWRLLDELALIKNGLL